MEALLPQPAADEGPATDLGSGRAGGVRAMLARARQALDASFRVNGTVRGAAELGELARAEVLATIPRFGPAVPRAGARPLPDAAALAAYRVVRASLASRVQVAAPVVVLTSARSGDGKTTTAANLALVSAQAGARVLLVDAETRRGDQHALFGVQSEPGFFHLLFGQADSRACIRRVARDGAAFDLLPSGGATQADASELIAAGSLARLLDALRPCYDVIYVDSPPLEQFTDGARLGAHADAVLFVARVARTPRRAIVRAVRQLRHVRAPLVGVILNDLARR